MGVLRLKDFIRALRACKTAADERAVIVKESAAIRTSFKEDSSIETRHINIAKMLYIHMLGYPAHFGQIECLKLVAGGKFPDKRLGYLGIMLLLDENQEVLTLVTNSLKNDMNSSNMYTVGLALCTMGNIASAEMSRDLSPEVEKLIQSTNSYIKKKAALCAIKIIQKVPDLSDQYVDKAKNMLTEKNHAVLLTGLTLMAELCKLNPNVVRDYRAMVPHIVRVLKSLITGGNSPEHDVFGINDPFIQVQTLRLLRILANGNREASDAMSDVLAQIATNTDGSRNVGNAILYETCLTIMDIEADSALRVLAINILGRFLANMDNNIRYVALNTLTKTVNVDMNAVQRHRNTVLDCLRDLDISIRRRALELSFALINDGNVRVMVRELLVFLEVADHEFKVSMPPRLCAAADEFAPNKRWHIDTVIRILKLAGNYVKEDVLSNFIKLVASVPELHAYSVYKIFYLLKQDLSQEALVLSGVWCIGEYGEILLQKAPNALPVDDPADAGPPEDIKDVSDKEIVDLLEYILESPYNSTVVTEYVVTALLKLTTRIQNPTVVERIKSILSRYTSSLDIEIQQRTVEYLTLLTDPKLASIRAGVLERMPVPPPPSAAERKAQRGMAATSTGASPQGKQPSQAGTGGLLEDLLGGQPTSTGPVDVLSQLGGLSLGATAPAQAASGLDLLADVFGSSATKAAPTSDIMGLFGSTGAAPAAAPAGGMNLTGSPQPQAQPLNAFAGLGVVSPTSAATAVPVSPASTAGASVFEPVMAYQKNNLQILFKPSLEAGPDAQSSICLIQVLFRNGGPTAVQELNFQVAVPKTLKLQLLPASSQVVPSMGTANQSMKVLNPIGKTAEGRTQPIRLRLKIVYAIENGPRVDEMVEFNGFGSSWQW